MIEKISKAALASKPFNLTEGMLSLNVIPSAYPEHILREYLYQCLLMDIVS